MPSSNTISKTEGYMRETPLEMFRAGFVKVSDGIYVGLESFARWKDEQSEIGRARLAYLNSLIEEGQRRGQELPLDEKEKSKRQALREYLDSLMAMEEKKKRWQELNAA